jgi:hypothetical protein
MNRSWLEGHEPARAPEVARHYTGELDWTTISPTIDWAGGGLITTMADLALFVRALWSERIIGSRALGELTRWTPGATFPPGHMLRYEHYGRGMGSETVEGVDLLGHTGFAGAFAFHAPGYDAVLPGTHSASQVDRWPLGCRALPGAARGSLIKLGIKAKHRPPAHRDRRARYVSSRAAVPRFTSLPTAALLAQASCSKSQAGTSGRSAGRAGPFGPGPETRAVVPSAPWVSCARVHLARNKGVCRGTRS